MTTQMHLLLLKSELLTVDPVSNRIDPTLLKKTFPGGVVKDEIWHKTYNKGYQTPTVMSAYPHEFFDESTYQGFIPEDPRYFFRGLCQVLQCVYSNPFLVGMATTDNLYHLHLPYKISGPSPHEGERIENTDSLYVAHVYSENGKLTLRCRSYADASYVLNSKENPHLVVLPQMIAV